MKTTWHTVWLVGAVALLGACEGADEAPPPMACAVDQPFPYADTAYVSNHVGPGNSDYIPCEGPERFQQTWHALQSHAAAQPNTFSPDGRTTYVTTTPGANGCTVHALDTRTGETRWCRSDFSFAVAAGVVEVDEDGRLYLTHRDTLHALDPTDGATVWSTTLPDSRAAPGLTYGMAFSSDGHIVTQVSDGTVVLVDRAGGEVLATLDVAGVTGFVAPGSGPLPLALVPDYVWQRFGVLLGSQDVGDIQESITAVFGSSGAFADNTVAVAGRRIFTVGGGPAPDIGSVVAIDIVGTAERPALELAWAGELAAGSASSVSLWRGGERVIVADGQGQVYAFDSAACAGEAGTDDDNLRCAPAWVHPGDGFVGGSISVDPAGNIYVITTGAGRTADVIALRDAGDRAELRWAMDYGPNEQFTTVLTVTDNLVYGMLTTFESFGSDPLYVGALPFPIPRRPVTNEAVALDPATGEKVWGVPAPNSSLTELLLGPDGALYLTMAGGAEAFVFDPDAPDPVAGLARFDPAPAAE